MKLNYKLNQATRGNNFPKAAKILLNQNQKSNEQLPMNNQEAVDAFAEKKINKKTNESKTDKLKDHEKIVSKKTRDTSFRAPNLS